MRSLLLFAALLSVSACASPSSKSNEPAENAGGDEGALERGRSTTPALVVPLIDENKKLLSRYNDAARAKGKREIPDTVEVKTQSDGRKVADLRSYFDEEIMPAVNAPAQAMPAWGPDSFTNWSRSKRTPGLCYRGEPKKAVELITTVADSVFSEQTIVHGWRYKAEKHFNDGDEEYESDFPDVWSEWRGTGNAILVVTSIGDGGDDLSPAIIPLCK